MYRPVQTVCRWVKQGKKAAVKSAFPTVIRTSPIQEANAILIAFKTSSEMDKIVYRLVYNRKNRLNKKGQALVQVEAYQKSRKKYFSTHVYLRPEQWDGQKGMVRRHPNGRFLNKWLYDYMARIEEMELELSRLGKPTSLEIIKYNFRQKRDRQSFLVFYEKELEEAGLRESSLRNHRSTLALLKAFKDEILFTELTFELLCSFEHFLNLKGYHANTIAKHMKHLKRYINQAINKDYLSEQQYAFRKYKIKTVEYRHTHLTPDELKRLENLRQNGAYARYRKTLDAFLFCCYVGVRYSDFVRLGSSNVVRMREETWLVYRTVKTGVEVHLPLDLLFGGKAIGILNTYRRNTEDFFRLKNNSNINKELKRIAQAAGLKKSISFHTARHTNATLLIYSGVNITTVQKLLGHKSVKTTQVYASVMDRTIVQDLKQHRMKSK